MPRQSAAELHENPGSEHGSRARILESARELFYRRGYEATSLKQVADAAHVHGGSVYHFFPSKAALVEAVLASYRELLEPVLMAPARAASPDPIGRVLALLAGYRAHLLATDFQLGCPIGSLALELAESQPRARALVVENFEGWRSAVAEILRQGDTNWVVDPSVIAAFVLTVMEGAVMQARSYRSVEPFDACVAELERYLESCLSPGEGE